MQSTLVILKRSIERAMVDPELGAYRPAVYQWAQGDARERALAGVII